MTTIDRLHHYLATIPPGPIPDPGGDKFLGRMEEVLWEPPVLSFTVERHGGTVKGSSRATLQEWTLDLEKKTAHCVEARFRQVRPQQSRFDVGLLAEEVASAICQRRDDHRLKWYKDGRVRVLIGKVLPKGSAVKQTLAGRRKRFREGLRNRLEAEGWREAGVHVYGRGSAGGQPGLSPVQ